MMGIPRKIKIKDGNSNGKTTYYYWNEYETDEEATQCARRIKKERRQEGMKVKYFILETQDSWFLPVPRFVVYLNKKLRLL